jgi:hypothetical protein
MPTLHVDLREGFNRDTVVVRIDEREVFRRSGVETNYSVGLADRITVELPEGEVRVEVILPDRGIQHTIVHHVSGPATLAFALDQAGTLTGSEVEASPRYL